LICVFQVIYRGPGSAIVEVNDGEGVVSVESGVCYIAAERVLSNLRRVLGYKPAHRRMTITSPNRRFLPQHNVLGFRENVSKCAIEYNLPV
jgi:hypothetical protein